LVLTSREHIISLEPLESGLMGTLLRYPYEVRDEKEYFDDIQDVKVTKDMLDLARHIVTQKTASFDRKKFEDPTKRRWSNSSTPSAAARRSAPRRGRAAGTSSTSWMP
jgi:DNA end-binding protein Ku